MGALQKNYDLLSFLTFTIKVQEGQMKELDPSIINVVDLDIPQDSLMFTVLQQPQHGFLVNGLYGNDIILYKHAVNSHHELPVHSFSMEHLKNGKCSTSFYLCFFF